MKAGLNQSVRAFVRCFTEVQVVGYVVRRSRASTRDVEGPGPAD